MQSILCVSALLVSSLSTVAAGFAAEIPQVSETPTTSAKAAKSSTRKASLVFRGDVTVLSEPLPKEAKLPQLESFLRRKETIIAFMGGGEEPQEVPVTSEWETMWKKCCSEWYGQEYSPDEGDSIFSTDTWTKFPGLQLCTTVYSGVISNPKNRKVDVLLIGQKQTARGLPPIVWAFHQIMGTKRQTVQEPLPVESMVPSGPIKSTYCVEERQDDGCFVFRLDTSFEFEIVFPAVLLKLLPTSKAKAEKQGSAALSKTISKAGKKGIESGYKAFLGFYQQGVNRASQVATLEK